MLIDVLERTLPYPNKCHLPFILYPPGMHRNHEGSEFLRRIDMDQPGEDAVLYIGIPFCRTRCKSCPYFSQRSGTSSRPQGEAPISTRYKDSEAGPLPGGIGPGTQHIRRRRHRQHPRTENLNRVVDAVFDCSSWPTTASDAGRQAPDYTRRRSICRPVADQPGQPGGAVVPARDAGDIESPHAAEEARAIRAFQAQGFENIQLDLMYNLPGHRLEIWRRDLETLGESMSRTSPSTCTASTRNDPGQAHPDRASSAARGSGSPMVKAMYREALEIAVEGLHMYMVDHFCKPGYENMYNH